MSDVRNVIVHPLVFLSVMEHHHRLKTDAKTRVVGLLLGTKSKGVLDVTNCFAVPFEDDKHNPDVWFFDHGYLENMFDMLKNVDANETIVGWYSTGSRLKECDKEVQELIADYCENPVFIIFSFQSHVSGLTFRAYVARNSLGNSIVSNMTQMRFSNVPSTVEASEVEEIGMEHLLRNIGGVSIRGLSTEIRGAVSNMQNLTRNVYEISQYLAHLVRGKTTINQEICSMLQATCDLLTIPVSEQSTKAIWAITNGMMVLLYPLILIRLLLISHEIVHKNNESLKI